MSHRGHQLHEVGFHGRGVAITEGDGVHRGIAGGVGVAGWVAGWGEEGRVCAGLVVEVFGVDSFGAVARGVGVRGGCCCDVGGDGVGVCDCVAVLGTFASVTKGVRYFLRFQGRG